jgi:hypothetical protein
MDTCKLSQPTLQRRLRHLHSIAARNVVVPGEHGPADLSSLELFYTLHKDAYSTAFYTSEKIKGSSNPTWKSLSLTHMDECRDIDTASQSFFCVHLVLLCWQRESALHRLGCTSVWFGASG